MGYKLSEKWKADIGLVSQTINNSNQTGPYYSMKDCRRACAILEAGASADTKTTKLEILEATDNAGTSAAAISSKAATVTSPTLVTEATVATGSAANTDVVTINGLAFTKAAATSAADREWADADGLVTCVTDATYGVPGVTASNNAGTVTLSADPLGDATISLSKTENAGTLTLATTKHACFVEILDSDLSSGVDHIACKVTTTGNTPLGVILLREYQDRPAGQHVGASA